VIAAIDLHQLAQARATVSRLMQLRRPLFAGNPQPGLTHPAPHGFLRQHHAMTLGELLARQRRPKISIALTHQRHASRTDIHRQFAIAGLPTPRRNEPGGSGGLAAPHPPADLTLTQLQPFSRQYDRQAMLDDRLDDLHAFELVHADRDQSTSVHGLAPGWL
jgi:hypothetical protein